MDEWTTGHKINIIATKDLSDAGMGGEFHLAPEVMAVIRKLCDEIKVEWQMLLIGHVVGGDAYIEDYWIPKQEVTAASIKNLELVDKDVIEEKRIIATIHSHASMAVFCSGVDDEFTNLSLIQRHIVVNNKMEFHAVTTWYLPNGNATFLKAKMRFESQMAEEVRGIDNISKWVYTQPTKYPVVKGFKKRKHKHAIITELTDDDYVALANGYYDNGGFKGHSQ